MYTIFDHIRSCTDAPILITNIDTHITHTRAFHRLLYTYQHILIHLHIQHNLVQATFIYTYKTHIPHNTSSIRVYTHAKCTRIPNATIKEASEVRISQGCPLHHDSTSDSRRLMDNQRSRLSWLALSETPSSSERRRR